MDKIKYVKLLVYMHQSPSLAFYILEDWKRL